MQCNILRLEVRANSEVRVVIKIAFAEPDGLAYAVLVAFGFPVRAKARLALRLAIRK